MTAKPTKPNRTAPVIFKAVEFGKFIRRLRTADRLQIVQAAERAGLHSSTWMAAEKGEQKTLPAETIHRIALGLGVQTSYLMAKAGYGDEGDRWQNFTVAERSWMERALREQRFDGALLGEPVPVPITKMLDELVAFQARAEREDPEA